MPIRSNLAVPILTGAAVTHLLVMHWVHTECDFPDLNVPRLRLLGEMMTNALHRKRAFDDLRTSEERLERAAIAATVGLWEIHIPSGRIWVAGETRRVGTGSRRSSRPTGPASSTWSTRKSGMR